MGKRQVRVVVVPKWVTAILLVLTTAAMIAAIYLLAGRAYSESRSPAAVLEGAFGGAFSRRRVVALLMPAAANALIFVPWGFLFFVLIDRPARPRALSYALTLAMGMLFATGISLWQTMLPSRVTAPGDVWANAAGAIAGSCLGHLRKQVRVKFDY